MKALVYKGPGLKAWEEVPDPVIHRPTDVVVKMDATTICGTDLHILKGDVPEVAVGRILGHEGIGVITEVGAGVTQLAVGDRVILACVSSCGECSNCREGLYSHCLDPEGTAGIGWIFGYMIDGTQAEYVRVPFAENSRLQGPRGRQRRRGHPAIGHPAHRIRDRRPVRRRSSPATSSPWSARARWACRRS